MAKEADLKRIELKVSVSCCDGCKRKVKRVLQSIEGVLKTEVDPSQPKVTVLGNVDPQRLIKKLLKAGKVAELLGCVHLQNTGNEEKEAETAAKKGKESSQSKSATENLSNSYAKVSDKNKEEERKKGKDSKNDEKDRDNYANSEYPKANKRETELSPHPKIDSSTMYPNKMPDMVTAGDYKQYPYTVEPCAVAIPCYAVPPYMATLHPMHYGQGHYPFERVVTQPPEMRVGDYFSDDNPIGCSVM